MSLWTSSTARYSHDNKASDFQGWDQETNQQDAFAPPSNFTRGVSTSNSKKLLLHSILDLSKCVIILSCKIKYPMLSFPPIGLRYSEIRWYALHIHNKSILLCILSQESNLHSRYITSFRIYIQNTRLYLKKLYHGCLHYPPHPCSNLLLQWQDQRA